MAQARGVTAGLGCDTVAGRELVQLMGRRPVVVTGIPSRPLDRGSLEECAALLVGSADAVLSGDSGRARVQYSPTYRAELLRREGLRAWLGVNCRDRNAIALEQELEGLAAAGAAAVHLVTGDHTRSGDRPDARPVFDLEGTMLLPLARARGLLSSTAESPGSPPTARRAARVVEKHRAGAQLCLPQYAGEVPELAEFIDQVRGLGCDIPFLPGVPLLVDREGAQVLASFSGSLLPRGYAAGVLEARDPWAAGIRAAIALGEQFAGLEGVAGVVVAGGARPGGEADYCRALAEVARALGGGG